MNGQSYPCISRAWREETAQEGHCYPDDLRHVLYANPELCCSTIAAGDDEANAMGMIGLIVCALDGPSIKSAQPNDSGSIRAESGTIDVRAATITLEECTSSIRDRSPNDYPTVRTFFHGLLAR